MAIDTYFKFRLAWIYVYGIYDELIRLGIICRQMDEPKQYKDRKQNELDLGMKRPLGLNTLKD